MQSVFYVVVIISCELLIVLVPLYCPQFLIENHFLEDFINHKLLNILAIIMTVTVASAANIHLAFNRAEEIINNPDYFRNARKETNQSAYWLIGLFLGAVIILIVRSYLIEDMFMVSLLNGVALVILLMNILVLVDVVGTVFAMHPLSPPSDKI